MILDPLSKHAPAVAKHHVPPIHKATPLPLDPKAEAAWQALIDIANEYTPRLKNAFLNAVDELRAAVDEPIVVQWIERASPQAAADAIISGLNGGFDGVREAMTQTALDAMRNVQEQNPFLAASADLLPGDEPDHAAQRLIADFVLGPVRNISDETRRIVQERIAAGLKAGLNPREVARSIRPYIGLTEAQGATVDNFRALLESNDAEALNYELRDQRYDRTIQQALTSGDVLDQDAIDRMVERYAERMLNHRADTIARTESLNVLHAGQRAAWQKVVDNSTLMASDLRRFWHTAHDERTCPVCAPIPDMNPGGVGLDAMFETPDGPVLTPTMHPNCRCVVFTRPVIQGMENDNPSELVDRLRAERGLPTSPAFGKRDVTGEARDDHGRWTTNGEVPASAVFDYDHGIKSRNGQNVLSYYHISSGSINNLLRRSGPAMGTPMQQPDIEALDALMDHAPKLPAMTVYRGLSPSGVLRLIKPDNAQQFIGKVVQDDGYVSTSKDEGVAHDFITFDDGDTRTPGLFTIKIPAGTPGLDMQKLLPSKAFFNDWLDKEKEVLLPRGSQFKITSITHETGKTYRGDGNPYWHITAEWVGHERKPLPVTGRWFDPKAVTKYNHSHDPHNGEFTGSASSLHGIDFTRAEKDALMQYMTVGYTEINRVLRGRKDSVYTKEDYDAGVNGIKGLDAIFAKVKPLDHPIVVYRGLRGGAPERMRRNAKVGAVAIDNGFVSTTESEFLSNGFRDEQDMSMEIHIPTGAKVLTGFNSSEQEVLLPRGSQFKITQVGKHRIVADWIGAKAAAIPDADAVLAPGVKKFNPNHDPHSGEFTSEEYKAIYDYTGDAYADVNRMLRHGEMPQPAAQEYANRIVRDLDTALAKAKPTTQPMKVYRGLRGRTVGSWLKKGTIVQDNAFVSTSAWIGKAEDFASSYRGADTIAKITVPVGSKVLDIHEHSSKGYHEMEVLLPRGSRFRIDKVDPPDASYQRIVHATYLPPESVAKFNRNHDRRGQFTSGPTMLSVEHYSPVAGLTRLDPKYAGTGRPGAERRRLNPFGGVHVYDSKNARLEPQFQYDHRYVGQVPASSIYDLGKDVEGIAAKHGYDFAGLERAIKRSGFAGYRNSAGPNPSIIKLLYPLDVTPAKPRTYKGKPFGTGQTVRNPYATVKRWLLKVLNHA